MKGIILATVFFALACTAFTQEPDEGDIQFWNETKVYFPSIKITDDEGKEQKFISPHVMGTIRIGQDLKHFVNERIGFGFDIRLNDYFKFTPSYYYIAEQAVKNSKSLEHRVRFDLTAEKKWKNISISDRNRIEYRIRHSRDDSVRYRNKFKVKFPVRKDGKEIFSPFIADEPFYDFQRKEWSRNEFSAGIEKKFTSKASGEFFYMLQNNAGSRLKYVNIVGINLKFTIE